VDTFDLIGGSGRLAARLALAYVIVEISKISLRKSATRSEQSLLSRYRQPHARGRDREQIARARQAAEALFTAKPQAEPPAAAELAPIEPPVRKPRMLQISGPALAERNEAPETPSAAPAPSTREIPRSEFPRIRTLVKYGMTAAQVAQVCGVGVAEIQRILSRRP
jgi:hypothetical protein